VNKWNSDTTLVSTCSASCLSQNSMLSTLSCMKCLISLELLARRSAQRTACSQVCTVSCTVRTKGPIVKTFVENAFHTPLQEQVPRIHHGSCRQSPSHSFGLRLQCLNAPVCVGCCHQEWGATHDFRRGHGRDFLCSLTTITIVGLTEPIIKSKSCTRAKSKVFEPLSQSSVHRGEAR